MKILILSDPSSPHTIKWVNGLNERGIDVYLFGLKSLNKEVVLNIPNEKIFIIEFNDSLLNSSEINAKKISYLTVLPKLKKIIRKIKPDLVHSHYASSYGLLGSLCRFHPLIISAWGSDVYSFPRRSFLHKLILQYNLKKADKILSTSHIMSEELKNYTDKKIEITPFGIDIEKFSPNKVESLFNDDDLVIGTIKALEDIYGIEYLIKAFKILKEKHPELSLKLLIVGGGQKRNSLENLADELGVGDCTVFTGRVKYDEVPVFQNMLDISVSLSIEESFGVAILEASACGKPVVVSNASGFKEIVIDNVTGFIVEKENPSSAANAIEKLILDKNFREEMGKLGREEVINNYNFEESISKMMTIYRQILYTNTLEERF